MNAKESEKLFEDYLMRHGLEYEPNFKVGHGCQNVDFRVRSNYYYVLCDIKEIRDSVKGTKQKINAHAHIKSDIKKLRTKFGNNRPEEPCILVSMNFSSKFFTGLTVAKAMLGDIGYYFNKETRQINSGVIHLPRGNAGMTQQQNRSISGILVFDRVNGNHCLFTNPFTEHPVSEGFFPRIRVVPLTRDFIGSNLADLSNLIFWEG